MGGRGEFSSRRNFFRYQIPCMIFFRLWHEYFLGLIGVQEFFSFNFPLCEYFFGTSPAPISFLLVRPLLQKTGALFILINEFCNRGRDRK